MYSAWFFILFENLGSVLMSPPAHDLVDVLNTMNMGDPMVRNSSLYVTEAYDPGTTVPRVPLCRLQDLDFCCQDIWGPHWWEIQRLMIARRDHYITRYRAHYKQEPFEDPIVLQRNDFRAPMQADFTVRLREQSFPLIRPQLQFRCVMNLPYGSLLRYVAATIQLYFDARWTRVYRIFCIRMTEEAVKRSELTMQDPLTGEVHLHERWSGQCAPVSEKDQLRRQRQKPRRAKIKKEPSVSDRPASSLIRSRHVEHASTLPRKELTSGMIGCTEFPREFLSSETVLGAHASPKNNAEQYKTFFDDIGNWNLNHNPWISHDPASAANTALQVPDTLEMFADIAGPPGDSLRHTLSTTAPGPTNFLASPEVLRTVVDIDLESMIASNPRSRVEVCAKSSTRSPEVSFDLQLSAWRASEHMLKDVAGVLENSEPRD